MPTFLQPGDEQALIQFAESGKSDLDRKRAQILLGIEAGLSAHEIAERVGASIQRVLHWRREYLKRGLSLFD